MQEIMELRRELARQLREILRRKAWTQAQAATRLGTTQPRISNLYKDRVEGISMEQLVTWLAAFDHSVKVTVAEREDSPDVQARLQLLDRAREHYTQGEIWGALGLARSLLQRHPNFRAAGALVYEIMTAQGWHIDATAYRKYTDDTEGT